MMTSAILAVVLGLAVLVWSAERFVDGAASIAKYLGMPPLLIGMVIVGFGTSAPEMVISAFAAGQGNPGIAIGNAYGSNIANIALVLGLAALVKPIAVHSAVLRKELPILTAITALAAFQMSDCTLTRPDAFLLLGVFGCLMAWTVRQGLHTGADASGSEADGGTMPAGRSVFWLAPGLVLLIASSRVVVWGAVEMAHGFGVTDLIIGLTIVAVGTSLPELASSLIAARKGEPDLVLGNVLGSNVFNTLAVVGIAGTIHPVHVGREVLSRDMPVMAILTVSLFAIGYGFRGPGRINRLKGAVLLASYIGYTGFLLAGVLRS